MGQPSLLPRGRSPRKDCRQRGHRHRRPAQLASPLLVTARRRRGEGGVPPSELGRPLIGGADPTPSPAPRMAGGRVPLRSWLRTPTLVCPPGSPRLRPRGPRPALAATRLRLDQHHAMVGAAPRRGADAVAFPDLQAASTEARRSAIMALPGPASPPTVAASGTSRFPQRPITSSR